MNAHIDRSEAPELNTANGEASKLAFEGYSNESAQADRASDSSVKDKSLVESQYFGSVTGKELDFTPGSEIRDGRLDVPPLLDTRRQTFGNVEISGADGNAIEIPLGLYSDKAMLARLERPEVKMEAAETVDKSTPLVFNGNDAVSLIAAKADGFQLWKESKYRDYLEGGKLADAASVSLVLKAVGYDYADSANTNNLVRKLVTNGWKPVREEDAKPGDIVFAGEKNTDWRKNSKKTTIGIVGPDGTIYKSHGDEGHWGKLARNEAIDPQKYGDQVYYLRAPDTPPGQGESQAKDANLPSNWNQHWNNYWRDRYHTPQTDTSTRTDSGDRTQVTDDSSASAQKSLKIFDAAGKFTGRQVWKNSSFAERCEGGKLASTASVTEILNQAGFDYVNAGRVSTLAKQLLARGWKPVALDKLRPGDVLYGGKNGNWEEGGGNAQAAIVGERGVVYHNDPTTGVWTETNVQNAFPPDEYGNRVWALRPPDQEVNIPQNRDEYYDRDAVRKNAKGDVIASIAANSVGRRLWGFIRGTPQNLGCASSVSAVLDAAGYKYARSAGVGGLESQLMNHGWVRMHVSQAQPGDVVIGARTPYYAQGGGGSHIGIVTENGQVTHNSSGSGRWTSTSLNGYYNTSRFRAGVWILRPPSSTTRYA